MVKNGLVYRVIRTRIDYGNSTTNGSGNVAIANGGIYYEPYIVDSIIFSDGRVAQNSPKPLRRVIKEETSKKVVAMLTEGATIGFAKKGSVEGMMSLVKLELLRLLRVECMKQEVRDTRLLLMEDLLPRAIQSLS